MFKLLATARIAIFFTEFQGSFFHSSEEKSGRMRLTQLLCEWVWLKGERRIFFIMGKT